jgi:hypothetical protein
MDTKLNVVHARFLQRHSLCEYASMKFLRESTSVPGNSAVRNAIVAIVTFFVAHVLLRVGVTTRQIPVR